MRVASSMFAAVCPTASTSGPERRTWSPFTSTFVSPTIRVLRGNFSPRKFSMMNSGPFTVAFTGKWLYTIFISYAYPSVTPTIMLRRWAANVPTSAPSRRRGYSQRTFACLPWMTIWIRGWDSFRRSVVPFADTTMASPSSPTSTPPGISIVCSNNPATGLDEFERLDVPVVLHHLQDPADQLRCGPDHAFRLAGRLRVPDRRHRIVERVLQHPITSTVLPEAELVCNLAETLAAEMESVASDNAPLTAAPETALLPAEILRPLHSTTSTLKRSFMNWMPSARDTRCRRGTGRGRFARRETRHPGRCRLTLTSIPNTPISGSYFIPGKSV